MDFGIHIGTRGCLTSRENVMAVAQCAEALGYAYLGVSDHLIVPVQSEVRYPYTADGRWPGADTGDCFDCIATLAFLAGCTQRIKLLTSVVVVPYRPAVLTAKLFTTADVLSGGRVIAGIGVGWMPEEFAALGAPPFAERGAVTDEYLETWRLLWTDARPAYDGICKVRRCAVLAETSIAAGSSDLGRRRERPCVATHGEVRRRLVSGVEQSDTTSARPRASRRVSNNCIAWRSAPAEILHRSMSPTCGLPHPCGIQSVVPSRGSCSAAARMTCWPTQPPWRQPGRDMRSSMCNARRSRRRWT